MSLDLIALEMRRFLESDQPEVLCVTGKWGVGKTFAWKKYLAEAVRSGTLGTAKYAYVSLFGIRSLDELRFSIVENTVTGHHVISGPNMDTVRALFAKGSDSIWKLKPFADFSLALLNKQSVGEVIARSSFLSVRNRLICLDDLERAGETLKPRDVLGLASMLKEDRQCKIVLLLNEEQMDEASRVEFNRQLEKVADLNISFDLSPHEAAQIAFTEGEKTTALLGPHTIQLQITNIRVLKKIERLARRMLELLNGYDDSVLAQAGATLALGAWAAHEPGVAPPLARLRDYNSMFTAMREHAGGEPRETHPWAQLLESYPFSHADAMDTVILDATASGFFDEKRLRETATELQANLRRQGGEGALSRAWRELYHGSLAVDDQDFLDMLYEAAVEDIRYVSFTNLNSAIFMLREYDSPERADSLVQSYLDAHSGEPIEFFDIDAQLFDPNDHVDEKLKVGFQDLAKKCVEGRDALEVFESLGEQGHWNDADRLVMARQSATDFERMFEAVNGPNLKRAIRTLLTMGRGEQGRSPSILLGASEALMRIAKKSPLRARKVSGYGVEFQDAGQSAAKDDPI